MPVRFSVRQVLTVTVGALFFAGLLAAIAFSYKLFNDAHTAKHALTLQTARSMTNVVDGELAALSSAVQSLAVSPALRDGRLDEAYAHARAVLPQTGGFTFVLSTPDGQQVFNTLVPRGRPLPRHGYPPELRAMAAAPRPMVSNLFMGAVLGKKVLTVGAPVLHDGKLAYVLDIGVLPDRFGELLLRQHLEPEWIAAILDHDGQIVARSREAARFVGMPAVPDVLAAMARQREGKVETVTLEGIPVTTIYSRSARTGWSVIIGVPTASVKRELWGSMSLLLLGAGVLLALGLAASTFAARRIVYALGKIVPLAETMGRGEAVHAPPMALKEAQEVADAVERASGRLAAADAGRRAAAAELQRLNSELEQRVDERTAELRQARALLDAIIDNIPVMVTLQDAVSLRYQHLNRAAASTLRLDPARCLGKAPAEVLPPAAAAAAASLARAALAQGSGCEHEAAIAAPDGTRLMLRQHALVLRGLDGQPLHVLTMSLDVTAARRAEEDLRLAATAFDAQEPMLITDAQRRIVRANRAFVRMSGYSVLELEGNTPRVLSSGRHDAVFYAALWESIHLHDSWQGEIWNRRRSGELFPCWATISAIRGPDGHVLNYVAVYTDITQQKHAEDEIRRLAFYDALTGLPNRRLLMDRLQHALAASARTGAAGALMFIDLDNFKTLNDTLGHDRGDELLRQVGARLPGCVREGDTVARLGGDEFVVMLENLGPELGHAAVVAGHVGEKVLAALNEHYLLGGRSYHCTPSIGVALFADHHASVEETLRHADLAMYEAKSAGRNAIRFFEPHMQDLISEHMALESDLREALQRGYFVMHFQPQVDAADRVVGAEALLRWQPPGRELVLPEAFIGLAEETGLILGIGRWVLETACTCLAQWAHDPALAEVALSVNVSARQFQEDGFVSQLQALLAQTGADPHRLKLELTESLLLHDVPSVTEKIMALRSLGIAISLDDFGVGYSSLSYLRHLKLDQLKIDRSFVHNVAGDASDAAIARTIVTLAQTLGLSVVAEGVETLQQRDVLGRQGCTFYQGFLFAQPLAQDDFEAYVRGQRSAAQAA
jgi:diguanylate cyclase (GGDEF)-like protein/PAS domain S-box-containing protein